MPLENASGSDSHHGFISTSKLILRPCTIPQGGWTFVFECFTELYNLGASTTHNIKTHQKKLSCSDINVPSLHLRSCVIFHLRVRKDFLLNCLSSQRSNNTDESWRCFKARTFTLFHCGMYLQPKAKPISSTATYQMSEGKINSPGIREQAFYHLLVSLSHQKSAAHVPWTWLQNIMFNLLTV